MKAAWLNKVLPRRLRAQVGLIVSLLLAVTIGLFAWHMSRSQGENIARATSNEAAVIAKSIANLSIPYALTEDYASIETLLVKMAELPAIVSIAVCDNSGNVFSQVFHAPASTPMVSYSSRRFTPPGDARPLTLIGKDGIVAWHPVYEGSLLGWVRIDYSLNIIRELQRGIWRDAFISAALAVTVGIFLILFFLNRHILAVGSITDFANRLAELKGGTLSVSDGSLETDQLVSALNQTSQRLYDQDRSLKESAENIDRLRFRNWLILQSAGEGIIGLDREGRQTFVNPAAARMLGYGIDDLIGKSIAETWYHPPDDSINSADLPIFATLRDGLVHHEDREEFLRKNSRRFPVAYTTTPVREGNTMTGAVITFRDITERKLAESALRESEKKYRTLFEESKDVIFFSTPDGRFMDINHAGVELFGYDSKEELLGIDIANDLYVDPFDRDIFKDIMTRQGFIKDHEIRLRKKNSDERLVLITATAVTDQTEGGIAYRGILRDVTEERKLEMQLRHAQKMEAVGQLTGGIAHDFNNILTAIIGFAYVLQSKLAREPVLSSHAEQITASAQKAASLTQSLLAFSSKQATNPRPIAVNDIILGLRKLLSKLIGEEIEFIIKTAPENPFIMADSGQMDQVLMNLAANARDAMPAGGSLTIQIEAKELDDSFIAANGFGSVGSYVLLSVSDTGAGMDESTTKRIFEPFFTTKEVGKGTGLGLSIVYGIVKQHNGFITVSSKRGAGTTFELYLPAVQAGIVLPQHCDQTPEDLGGTETILVAEDDNDLRSLMGTVLDELGYRLIYAFDGEDAVVKFKAHEDSIDLLLFDLTMPRKTGREAYEEIKKIRPDIKALFISGHSWELIKKRGLLEEDNDFVAKPVAPLVLFRKIREILERKTN